MGMEGKERNGTEEGTFRSHLPPLCAFYDHYSFPTQRSKKTFCVCKRPRLSLGREKKVFQSSSDTCFGNSPFVVTYFISEQAGLFSAELSNPENTGNRGESTPKYLTTREHITTQRREIQYRSCPPPVSTTTTTAEARGGESSQDNGGKRRSRILNFPFPMPT